MPDTLTPETCRGAVLSPCRTWRYALWRRWDWQGFANNVMFIGINPSTADETRDDATIRKCIGFAKRWGYGGIYMLNLFAFRATEPMNMVRAIDPVGPANAETFGYYRSKVGLIVAAWGNSVPVQLRPNLCYQTRIEKTLREIGTMVHCLGRNHDGSPRHPVRLPYSTQLEPFWSPSCLTP